MILLSELLKGNDFNILSPEIQHNLLDLLQKINILGKAWKKPMIVTSGFRTMAHHIEIYKEKAAKLGIPFDESKIPMHSKHLTGQAVDISDPLFSLTNFCHENNNQILKEIGFWCEKDVSVPRLHLQTSPSKSGDRWFLP